MAALVRSLSSAEEQGRQLWDMNLDLYTRHGEETIEAVAGCKELK